MTAGYLVGPGANLSGAHLSRVRLRGRRLTGTNLSGANLSGANLIAADLSQSDLTRTTLTNANLFAADLNESSMADASLGGATLFGLRGVQLDLSRVNLRGAHVQWAQLSSANLTSADLSSADLSGAQLTGAVVQGAKLGGATLRGVSSGGLVGTVATLPGGWIERDRYLLGPGVALRGANLARANLAGADLAGATLPQATLAKADLSAVDLHGAQLSRANLTSANLSHATISSADIGGAQLAGANFSGIAASATSGVPATLPPGWAMVNGNLTSIPSSIAENTYFNQGQWLQSSNGAFTVNMQGDGNLVEYQGGTAIWATGTSGPVQTVMQSDCNLVIYRAGQVGQPPGALYTTGTGGAPNAACTFSVADDGSLTVATGTGTVRWERYANGTIFTHRITMTQNAGVFNGTNTSSGQIDTIPAGQSPAYVCWTTGQRINNVDVWFYVLWNGKAGYYASAYDDSVYSSDSRISIDYGIPQCGSVPTTFTPPNNGTTGQTGPTTISAPIAVTTATNIRPGPSTASGSPLATMPNGTSPGFLCWTTGQVVSGVDVWFKVYWSGATGYYASALDNSSYTTDSQITSKYGIPPCPGTSGGGGGTTTGSGGNSSIEATAANWARGQVGSKAWEYACLAFVYQAWESAGVSRSTLDAIAGYSPNANTYPVDEWGHWAAGNPPGGIWHSGFDPAPPNGAIIYYSNRLGRTASHTTISVGGGAMISPGTAGVVGPVSVTYNSWASMLGWWMPK